MTMKNRLNTPKLVRAAHRGFTLVELMVAMAITSILVYGIMQITTQGMDLWKGVREDISTTNNARVALETMCHDLESMQMRAGNNKYQWLLAKADKNKITGPKGIKIPKSVQCVFFVCAPDRNPAVSSSPSLRRNYRNARAQNIDTQGDVSAVGYRLMYRDQILQVPGDARDSEGAYPLFSLYRHVIVPRETFRQLLGSTDLGSSYVRYEQEDENFFLCENVLEMNLMFNIQYAASKADAAKGLVAYASETVPVITTSKSGNEKRVEVYGDRIVAGGTTYSNARIVSANVSITVVTEEGAMLAEQVRLGRRRAPKPAEFFEKYTRSFSRCVAVPQPL